MKRQSKAIALITGAGSGIGRETAQLLAQQYYLVLVDISQAGLDTTAGIIRSYGGESEQHICDVSKRKDMQALARHVEKKFGALDVLINNAGIGSAGEFLHTSLDTWDRVMDVNLKGVVHGCHYFVPAMVARGEGGTVVNLSSVAGFYAAKEMPIYSASKFAVLGFSESIRAEFAQHDIHVVTVCPGIIDTAIVENTVFEGGKTEELRKRAMKFYKKRNYPAIKVAKAIVAAIEKRKTVVPVSPEAWALYYGKRFAPKLMERLGKMDAPI